MISFMIAESVDRDRPKQEQTFYRFATMYRVFVGASVD